MQSGIDTACQQWFHWWGRRLDDRFNLEETRVAKTHDLTVKINLYILFVPLSQLSHMSAMAFSQTPLDVFNPPKSVQRNVERWSRRLSEDVGVFVFPCVKRRPLGLNIAGILFLFPLLSLSLSLSCSLFLSWLLCHRGEGNSDPIVNGGNWAASQWCHLAIGKTRGNALLAFGMHYFFLLFSGRRWSI